MMSFVRAEREVDWALHLSKVEQMLPYFFAVGHFSYARYGLYYLRCMQRLPPTLLTRFLHGEHVMRHRDGVWNGLWSNMFIETTHMRYGHRPKGIIWSTLNESTLAIWALSAGSLGQLVHDLHSMTTGDMADTVTCHSKELLQGLHQMLKSDKKFAMASQHALMYLTIQVILCVASLIYFQAESGTIRQLMYKELYH